MATTIVTPGAVAPSSRAAEQPSLRNRINDISDDLEKARQLHELVKWIAGARSVLDAVDFAMEIDSELKAKLVTQRDIRFGRAHWSEFQDEGYDWLLHHIEGVIHHAQQLAEVQS